MSPADSDCSRAKHASAGGSEDQPPSFGETTASLVAMRHRGAWWLAALIAAAALYGLTMAPGLLWGDSGESQLHTLLGGWLLYDQIARSHPLYYALARAIALLPGVSAAWAANAASVVGGTIAVANVAWIARTACTRRIAALSAVVLLAVSHTLWQLSTSAEVISLSAALLSAEWIAFIRLAETGHRRWWLAIALFNGLGVADHNLALLMWPVYGLLAIAYHRSWRGRDILPAIGAVAVWMIGALPVLALAFHQWVDTGSIYETARSLLVGHYGQQVKNAGHLPRLVGIFAGATVLNFPTPTILAVPIGIVAWLRRPMKPTAQLILLSGLVNAGFAARYHIPDQHTFMVPFFMCIAITAGVGIDHCLALRRAGAVSAVERNTEPMPIATTYGTDRNVVDGARRSPILRRLGWSLVATCALAPIVYAAVPPLLRRYAPTAGPMPVRNVPYRDRFAWFLRPWRAGYDGPERFARETLAVLPADAWLVADSTLVFPINYLQAAESLRRDVRLDNELARQPWLPTFDDAERDRRLAAGSLFSTANDVRYLPCAMRGQSYEFTPVGPVYAVRLAP